MRAGLIAVLGGAAFLATGCATGAAMPSDGGAATANVRNAAGAMVAQAEARNIGSAVHLRVTASGMAPGTYGAHIHMIGRCDGPAFATAGAHWNPAGRQHGSQNALGPHLGDLPNLVVGADGTGAIEFNLPDAAVTGGVRSLLDGDGSAIVLHAGPDDYRTDPSGNSGARIACGVFR
jgi:Cu-Zn family superoxide dismutase